MPVNHDTALAIPNVPLGQDKGAVTAVTTANFVSKNQFIVQLLEKELVSR
ncbi:hypothetical protein XBI1_880002 [Xenorhabdus bovienii str. Intermedium]|uniref:Uncharacterized protein n=1 Tax=Xenorhabdus bovienii str. Intermedium TaxID=1379677 RepID=A0A077QGQ4_XENBV|nr:hypothetical protein XBI1_880002 [Xenorhabdus bovienii str. Intermedium]